jgi:hypothetical protein
MGVMTDVVEAQDRKSISAKWAKEWLLQHLSGVLNLKNKDAKVHAYRCSNLRNLYLVVASVSLGETFADPNLHLGYLVWLTRSGETRFDIILNPVGTKGLFEPAEIEHFSAERDTLVVKYRLHGRKEIPGEVTHRLWDVTSSLRGHRG